MWHAARQQEKKIKVLMVDHKKRAERRKAYYESRLGDPSQLLRLTGTAIKLYPDAEQHFYYENPEKSLMTWEGDEDTRIDRFDGRSLLDYLPADFPSVNQQMPNDERDIQEELNFERFRELVENERRNVSEKECLEENEAEWTSLLERHKALMKKLQEQAAQNQDFVMTMELKNATHHQEDILDYVENLTEKDRQTLNEMGRQYNIPDYTRLLRVAKRDRQEKANELKETEKVICYIAKEENSQPYSTRDSPTYEPYTDTNTSSSSSEDQSNKDNIDANEEGFIIRFGDSEESLLPESQNSITNTSDVQVSASSPSRTRKIGSAKPTFTGSGSASTSSKAVPQKKLTPAEKLRLKTQMGLNKQIKVDERKKIQKEREQELERLTQEEIPFVSTKIARQVVENENLIFHLRNLAHDHIQEPDVQVDSARYQIHAHHHIGEEVAQYREVATLEVFPGHDLCQEVDLIILLQVIRKRDAQGFIFRSSSSDYHRSHRTKRKLSSSRSRTRSSSRSRERSRRYSSSSRSRSRDRKRSPTKRNIKSKRRSSPGSSRKRNKREYKRQR
ncbi:9903_t:CDS:10 [Ambispora gerdemannii]|uniref:9903_t:CDS:1 n=1 Tax=Ambispora gerdemannii TaxID=144530 RepID=A0A9N9ACI9_9GLOM|nr:9903_t:CDS:10 [Ambispora gerdemannii]